MSLHNRLKAIEARDPLPDVFEVWLNDPSDREWSTNVRTGERVRSVTLKREGVMPVTLDIGNDRHLREDEDEQ